MVNILVILLLLCAEINNKLNQCPLQGHRAEQGEGEEQRFLLQRKWGRTGELLRVARVPRPSPPAAAWSTRGGFRTASAGPVLLSGLGASYQGVTAALDKGRATGAVCLDPWRAFGTVPTTCFSQSWRGMGLLGGLVGG